ncbi:hypothetical protein QTP88_019866 [Uroleucon formosanum]
MKTLSSSSPFSDRTLYQRDFMRKLHEELAACSSNGETGLTIKFIKGVPRIVKNSEVSNSKPQDFLISAYCTNMLEVLELNFLFFVIRNMELGLSDYNVFRDDRDIMLNSRSGGVLLAVRNDFDCSLINIDNVPGIQHIFVLLKYNKMNIPLGCVYIPPSSYKDIYIYIYIYEALRDSLKQVNNVCKFRNDILDFVLTNTNIDNIRAGCSLTPLIDSYHPPLDLIYSILVSKVVPESVCSIIHNFNYLITFLSNIDLNYNILNLDLEKSVLKFYDILNHSIDIFVPKVKLNLQHRHSITWSNPSLRNLINLKKQAH